MTDTTQAAPTAAPAPVAPPTGDGKVPRESVAKHELLAAPGGDHVAMTEAVGIRYTDRTSGDKFEWFPSLPPAVVAKGVTLEDFAGSGILMTALFGGKTKATNEASRVRNGDGGTTAEQLEAIDEVFANLDKGIWREKAEGGGGSRTDKRLLAEVLIAALGEKAAGTIDTYQNRLETEDGYLKKVLSNDAIKSEYRKRAGKTGPAVESLA